MEGGGGCGWWRAEVTKVLLLVLAEKVRELGAGAPAPHLRKSRS